MLYRSSTLWTTVQVFVSQLDTGSITLPTDIPIWVCFIPTPEMPLEVIESPALIGPLREVTFTGTRPDRVTTDVLLSPGISFPPIISDGFVETIPIRSESLA